MRNPRLLFTAVAVFLLSAGATMIALEIGSRGLAVAATVGMGVAGLLFLLSMLGRRRVDWNRINAEQRLWESGPLGRSWLRVRRRLSDKWKL